MSDTTIRISTETQKRLKALGIKGESYEEILQRLLDEKEKHAIRICRVR